MCVCDGMKVSRASRFIFFFVKKKKKIGHSCANTHPCAHRAYVNLINSNIRRTLAGDLSEKHLRTSCSVSSTVSVGRDGKRHDCRNSVCQEKNSIIKKIEVLDQTRVETSSEKVKVKGPT